MSMNVTATTTIVSGEDFSALTPWAHMNAGALLDIDSVAFGFGVWVSVSGRSEYHSYSLSHSLLQLFERVILRRM